MFMKKIAVLLLSFFVITNLFGETIQIVTEEWEDSTNADGTGLYFDILREVYEPEGYELELKIVPYVRASRMVQNEMAHIMVGSYLDEIEDVLYPDLYFDADDISAMYLSSNSHKWDGESSLSGTKTTFIRGYEIDGYLDVPVNVYEIDDRETALKLLDSGRVDYFLDNIYELEDVLSNTEEFNSDYFTISSFKDLPLYMIFSSNELGEELREVWNRRFNEIIQNGRLMELYSNWDYDDELYSDLLDIVK